MIEIYNLPLRFIAKVDFSGPIPEHRPELGPCWIWTACNNKGYGQFRIGSRTDKTKRSVYSHRFTYELLCGIIPKDLECDHLCKNSKCVNPNHIELVTHQVNILRGDAPSAQCAKKTHCPKGHPYDLENTHHYKGSRYCRTCRRETNYKMRQTEEYRAYNREYQRKYSQAKRQDIQKSV